MSLTLTRPILCDTSLRQNSFQHFKLDVHIISRRGRLGSDERLCKKSTSAQVVLPLSVSESSMDMWMLTAGYSLMENMNPVAV